MMQGEATRSGRDRTAAALQQYIDALPASSYDVRVVGFDRLAQVREFAPEMLIASGGWLRHCNAQGSNVYLRPLSARHVLLDDLTDESLAEFTAVHVPSCIVETSPGSYQAWISVSAVPIDPTIATRIARSLAQRFGGDFGAASAFQPGRAPGLCNRKPERAGPDGRGPWVLVRHAKAVIDPKGPELIEDALAAGRAKAAHDPPPGSGSDRPPPLQQSPAEEHAAAAARVMSTLPGGEIDRSRLDFAIARRLIGRGHLVEDVGLVLQASAKAGALPARDAERYIRRTTGAAAQSLAKGGMP